MRIGSFAAGLAVLLLAALWGEAAVAQAAEAGETLESAIDVMRARLVALAGNLETVTQQLLLVLLGVDLVLRCGRWAIFEDRIDQLIGGFLFQVLIVFLVYATILVVPGIVRALVEFVMDRAADIGAGVEEMTPGKIIADGLGRAVAWLDQMDWNPGTWFFLFAAAFSVIATAAVVGMLVIVYAEIYLVALAGMITLGFAGLGESRGIAVTYLHVLLGKALKLLGLVAVYASLGEITNALTEGEGAGIEQAISAVMLQAISVLLVLVLPGTIEALASRAGQTGAAAGVGRKAALVAGGALFTAGTVGAAGVYGVARGAVVGGMAARRAGGTIGRVAKGALRGAARGGGSWAKRALTGPTMRRLRGSIADLVK